MAYFVMTQHNYITYEARGPFTTEKAAGNVARALAITKSNKYLYIVIKPKGELIFQQDKDLRPLLAVRGTNK